MKATRTTVLLLAVVALAVSACGGSGDDTAEGEPATTSGAETDSDTAEAPTSEEAGLELYLASCLSCHGPDAGAKGPDQPLAGSDFIASTSSEDLVAFIKAGRSSSDPDNTSGLDMPVKGGNPALSDDDINDIVAYLKSIS